MQNLWDACLRRLEQELPAQQFNTWIRPLAPEADVISDTLVLTAPNRFVLELVRERFAARAAARPDQPHVLNYLGYSWIDQGVNLDEGMEMIKKAVQQRPDDGYIVDSLGWAYYRIGNYEEATKQLERAIELKPEDPTINDHLGDAYWRVGRVLEARFQWAHARDLKPDPEELPKIEEKLKDGLPEETSSQAKAGKKSGDGG